MLRQFSMEYRCSDCKWPALQLKRRGQRDHDNVSYVHVFHDVGCKVDAQKKRMGYVEQDWRDFG